MKRVMIEDKKRNELSWLKIFRDKATLGFEIVDCDGEKPDFLIELDGRLIGIEITALHIDHKSIGRGQGSKLRKEDGIKSELVARAKKLYFEKGYRSINAKFRFKTSSGNLSKLNRSAFACDIVDVLRQLQHLEELEKRRLDRNSEPPTPPPIRAIFARGLPEGIEPRWQLDNVGPPRELQPSDIEPCLAKKNKLVDAYRKRAPDNWLLIYSDGFRPHGRFRLPTQDQRKWPESKFERTYILCFEPDGFLIQLSDGGWAQVA